MCLQVPKIPGCILRIGENILKASVCYSSMRNPSEDKRAPGQDWEPGFRSHLCCLLAWSPGLFCLFGFNFLSTKSGSKCLPCRILWRQHEIVNVAVLSMSVFRPLLWKVGERGLGEVIWLFHIGYWQSWAGTQAPDPTWDFLHWWGHLGHGQEWCDSNSGKRNNNITGGACHCLGKHTTFIFIC